MKCKNCAFFSADTKGIDRLWKGPCIMHKVRVNEMTDACASHVVAGSTSLRLSDMWYKNYGDK